MAPQQSVFVIVMCCSGYNMDINTLAMTWFSLISRQIGTIFMWEIQRRSKKSNLVLKNKPEVYFPPAARSAAPSSSSMSTIKWKVKTLASSYFCSLKRTRTFAQAFTPSPSFIPSSITIFYLPSPPHICSPKVLRMTAMNISLNCILRLSIIKCHILINILKI